MNLFDLFNQTMVINVFIQEDVHRPKPQFWVRKFLRNTNRCLRFPLATLFSFPWQPSFLSSGINHNSHPQLKALQHSQPSRVLTPAFISPFITHCTLFCCFACSTMLFTAIVKAETRFESKRNIAFGVV